MRASFDPRRQAPGLEIGLFETGVFHPHPPTPTFPNGCQVCEVEIDPETGVTEILRYCVVDDVGTVINKLTLEGQIHGGIGQGVGQAFSEAIVYDGEGQLLDRLVPRLRHAAGRRHVLFRMRQQSGADEEEPARR